MCLAVRALKTGNPLALARGRVPLASEPLNTGVRLARQIWNDLPLCTLSLVTVYCTRYRLSSMRQIPDYAYRGTKQTVFGMVHWRTGAYRWTMSVLYLRMWKYGTTSMRMGLAISHIRLTELLKIRLGEVTKFGLEVCQQSDFTLNFA